MKRAEGGKAAAAYEFVGGKDNVVILVKVAHINQKDYFSFEKQ